MDGYVAHILLRLFTVLGYCYWIGSQAGQVVLR